MGLHRTKTECATTTGGPSPGALVRRVSYALVLLIPITAFWPVGEPSAAGVVPFFVTPGIYLSDLAVGAVLAGGLLSALYRGALQRWVGPHPIVDSFSACRGQWSPRGLSLVGVAARPALPDGAITCRSFGPHARSGARRESASSAAAERLRLAIALLALCGLAIATAPPAVSPGLAWYTALRWLAAAGVFLVLAWSDLPIRRVVVVFLAGLGLHVLVGIGQIVNQGPVGLPGEMALEAMRAGAAILTVGGQHWLRAYGLTFHPNVLGGFLAIGLIMGLPLVARVPLRFLWWWLWVGLLLSFSRSAWLATALVLPPVAGWIAWRYPVLRRPLVVTLSVAGVTLLVSGVLLAAQLRSRLDPVAIATERRSITERGALIGIALDVIGERPLTGVGAGNSPLAVLDAGSIQTPVAPLPVHNVPLLLATEVGVLGGGLWFWLWLAPGLTLGRLSGLPGVWPVALVGAWLALGIIALWDSYPWALDSGRLLTVTLLAFAGRSLSSGVEPALSEGGAR